MAPDVPLRPNVNWNIEITTHMLLESMTADQINGEAEKEVEWLGRQNGLKCCWVAGKRRFRPKFCATTQPTRQRQHQKDRRVGFGNNFCWGKRFSSNDDEYETKILDSMTVDRNKRTVDRLTRHRTTECCKTMRDTPSLSRLLLYFVLNCMYWSTLPLHTDNISVIYKTVCLTKDKGELWTPHGNTIHSSIKPPMTSFTEVYATS